MTHCCAFCAEFRKAIRSLGAKYPRAYQDFIQQLQPPHPALSRVHVKNSTDAAGVEDAIVPQVKGSLQMAAPGTARTQVLRNRGQHMNALVNLLPKDDMHAKFWPEDEADLDEERERWIGEESEVSSVDEFPVAGVGVCRGAWLCVLWKWQYRDVSRSN